MRASVKGAFLFMRIFTNMENTVEMIARTDFGLGPKIAKIEGGAEFKTTPNHAKVLAQRGLAAYKKVEKKPEPVEQKELKQEPTTKEYKAPIKTKSKAKAKKK